MESFESKQNKPKRQTSFNLTDASKVLPATAFLQHKGDSQAEQSPPSDVKKFKTVSDTIATNRFTHDFSRIPLHSKNSPRIQTKLTINTPGDVYEQEANNLSRQVMNMVKPQFLHNFNYGDSSYRNQQTEYNHLQTKRVPAMDSGNNTAPPIINEVLQSSGQPLDTSTRMFMEPRFGHDFSQVRVHHDSLAADSAKSVSALAFTAGNHIVFGRGQYAPGTGAGNSLLAHELTHTLQQSSAGRLSNPTNVQRYTPDELKAMADGNIQGRAEDNALAAQRNFQVGEMIFRLGSVPLAFLSGEEVTHGGIYIGDGLIHDAVGIGNRNVRVKDFFDTKLNEAAKADVYKRVRFKGPHRDLIVERLVGNIKRRDFRMPTDPVPFNLFSSAGDYKTATCLEYSHAQFLYAIKQLSVDQTVAPDVRQSLIGTYFKAGAQEPSALIKPKKLSLIGNTPDMSFDLNNSYSSQPPRTPSAIVIEEALMGAASAMASDVDPKKFKNRRESTFTQHYPFGGGFWGTLGNAFAGMTNDEVTLETFTYKSFVDSRQFFEDVT